MSPLPDDVRRALLALARQTIAETLRQKPIPGIPAIAGLPPDRPGAFVTLRVRGRLRGCVGQMEGGASLADTVTTCAAGAAMRDHRFSPLTVPELDALEIEISVLTRPQPLPPEEIEAGRHGLYVRRDSACGVLLPQVAVERGWTGERLLQEACGKAGLPEDAWRDPETQVLAFFAEVFSDADTGESRAAQAH